METFAANNLELLRQGAMLLALIVIDYTGVLAAILADLRSGLLKARRRGEKRTSRGLRRTVEKASRYFVTLFAMTVIDAMAIASLAYLSAIGAWSLPLFPLFTTVGAVGLCVIELKSIYENSQEKGDYDMIRRMVEKIIGNPDLRKQVTDLL